MSGESIAIGMSWARSEAAPAVVAAMVVSSVIFEEYETVIDEGEGGVSWRTAMDPMRCSMERIRSSVWDLKGNQTRRGKGETPTRKE